MDPDALENVTPGQSATHGDRLIDSTVLADVQSLWHELQGLTHDRFRLAALETQRAGESLVTMIMAGVMIAVVLSCAWMGLMAAAVVELVENGIMVSRAILLAVAFNLLLALILYRVLRSKSRYLQFPATLRSLQSKSPGCRDAQKQ